MFLFSMVKTMKYDIYNMNFNEYITQTAFKTSFHVKLKLAKPSLYVHYMFKKQLNVIL